MTTAAPMAIPSATALVRHSGVGLDLARSWVDLDKAQRRRRAIAAAQLHDIPELLDLVDVGLTLHGKRKKATSPQTRAAYRRAVRALLAAWAHEDLLSVDGDTAVLWVESLKGKDGDDAKPATKTRHVSSARALYAALRWAKATTADPFADVHIPTDPTPAWDKRAPYDDAVVERLLTTAAGDDKVLVLLGAHAGLRVSEMTALRWEDIDLAGRTLVVRQGKGGKMRSVALSRSLVEALKDLRDDEDRSVPTERSRYVLPYRSGFNAWRRMKVLCARAGVTSLGIHSLRHTAGTRVFHETRSLEDAARHLGHASIETARVYAKWDDTHLKTTVGEW